jgi:hypothetical protein
MVQADHPVCTTGRSTWRRHTQRQYGDDRRRRGDRAGHIVGSYQGGQAARRHAFRLQQQRQSVTPCFMSEVIEARRWRILAGAQHEQYSGAHAILVTLSPAEDALTVVPQDRETISHLRGGHMKVFIRCPPSASVRP